eukprot:EG_transcript_37630
MQDLEAIPMEAVTLSTVNGRRPSNYANIESHDIEDFLSMMSQPGLLNDDPFLRRMREMGPGTKTDSSTQVAPPEEMSEKEEEMLRDFEAYWSSMVSKYGAMPSVSITLQHAHATVMALKPRKQKRLDNVLTPIKRVFQRCVGTEVME